MLQPAALPSGRPARHILTALLMLAMCGPTGAHEKAPAAAGPAALQDVPLGALDMPEPMMRARIMTIPAGFRSPPHTHDGPGIRYVLEGQITIYWKDGSKRSYGPGDTYFEGPGENHPPNEMSAANEGDVPVKIYVVDLHPGN